MTSARRPRVRFAASRNPLHTGTITSALVLLAVPIVIAPVSGGAGRESPPAASSLATSGGRAPAVIDTFDGPDGAVPDRSRWTYELGGNGWGDEQLQSYTDRPTNVSLDGRGDVTIRARGESYTGTDRIARSSTSARIMSKATVSYGTVSARIELTGAPGAFPAFWLRGADRGVVGWPVCGEIDIMEALNELPTLFVTAHGPHVRGRTGQSWSHGGQRSPGGGLAGRWHTYSMTWTASAVSWALDGTTFRTIDRTASSSDERWTLDHPMNVILDVAVGGWAGPPAAPEVFRASMTVDWVRFRPPAG